MSHFLKKGLRRQNSIQQTISWGADAPAAQTCTLKVSPCLTVVPSKQIVPIVLKSLLHPNSLFSLLMVRTLLWVVFSFYHTV